MRIPLLPPLPFLALSFPPSLFYFSGFFVSHFFLFPWLYYQRNHSRYILESCRLSIKMTVYLRSPLFFFLQMSKRSLTKLNEFC